MSKLTSIFKMIGAQSSRLKTIDAAIQYIFNRQKSSPTLWAEQYLDIDNPLESWNAHPMHNTDKERKFLHAILCPYGKHTPNQKDMKEIVEGLFKVFDGHPLFTAIHTDHPQSPHIHILIHPRNISTNKVWQQSPQKLKDQKTLITSILESMGLYGITQTNKKYIIPSSPHLTEINIGCQNVELPPPLIQLEADSTTTHINKTTSSLLTSDSVGYLINILQHQDNLIIYNSIKNGIETMNLSLMEDTQYVKRIK